MATYYIDKAHGSASDSNAGTSESAPWLTFTTHVTSGSSNPVVAPGDTVWIKAGVYSEYIEPGAFGTGWITGTVGNVINFKAYGSTPTTQRGISAGTDAVIFRPTTSSKNIVNYNTQDCSYHYWEGIDFDGSNMTGVNDLSCINLNYDANNLTFRNCRIRNSLWSGFHTSSGNGSATTDRNNIVQYCEIDGNGRRPDGYSAAHGFYLKTRGNIVEYCNIHDNRNLGVTIRDQTDTNRGPRANIIRYNKVHHQDGSGDGTQGGINLDTYARENVIYRNIVYANLNHGVYISTTQAASDNLIYGNTIVDNGGTGLLINDAAAEDTLITNNIVYDNTTAQITDNGTNTVETTNLETDPSFNGYTSGSAWDFTIPTGSAAKQTGTNLGSPYNASPYAVDFAGLSVPQVTTTCIGAYEFPSPATNDPVVVMNSSYTGLVSATIDLSTVQVSDADGDARKAFISVTGTLTLSADGTDVTKKGGT